jgi:hypothetical protein
LKYSAVTQSEFDGKEAEFLEFIVITANSVADLNSGNRSLVVKGGNEIDNANGRNGTVA